MEVVKWWRRQAAALPRFRGLYSRYYSAGIMPSINLIDLWTSYHRMEGGEILLIIDMNCENPT